MTNYYPVYIQLENQPCIVIGGGKIAEGKVEGLLESGAIVEVISPALTPRLQELTARQKIKHQERDYRSGDLTGAFMVICATNIPAVNQQVWDEANENHQLVNVVDDTPRCNFIAPAILRNGDLTIAISTSGKAPALAVRLKEKIQKQIGPENARFLEIAGQLREPLARHIPDFETRKKLWYQIVDSDVLQLIADGNESAALDGISQIVGFEFTPNP
ncbi:MAG: bifunctional precorrin-2 dehydrogenase/sirohydrochlorin ferrochelatase [Anaerolineales bacterium]|nr:bifunctional precorrin-2 dehydrogenase/sirohydrochlorin ferrochelatase [Anaerolineales bacterium]